VTAHGSAVRTVTMLRRLPGWQLAARGVFIVIVVLAAVGPELTPFSPISASATDRLLPPGRVHWFGTDKNGIDILSRLPAAPRTDALIAVVATLISVLVGSPISVLVTVFGGTKINIITAIAFVDTPVFVRLVRSDVLTLVPRLFAEAARAVGGWEARVGFHHILPNVFPTIIVQLSVTVGFAILLTAGLSLVGAGVKPPTPELGSMIASGAKFLIINHWWPALFPGLALGATAFSCGVVGEILNEVMRPHTDDCGNRPAVVPEAVAAEPVPAAAPRADAILAVRDLDVSLTQGQARPVLNGVA
jgi:peptide/nickel transport system permease protein